MKKNAKIFLAFAIVITLFIAVPVHAANANPLGNVTCGTNAMSFPAVVPNLISLCVKLTRYLVPSLLIILGMIDFTKAVLSGDDKASEASKKNFIRRCLIAVVLFLTVSIITWIFALLSSRSNGTINNNDIVDCINCFINGSDSGYCNSQVDINASGGGGEFNGSGAGRNS